MNKRELRDLIRKNNDDPAHLEECSRIIQDKVKSLPQYQESRRVFCYVSMDNEVSTELILKDCLKNKELYVPKCYGKGIMRAVYVRTLDDMIINGYGVREPADDSLTGEEFDLVILPCLAAGINGERLGHGAGYYDRFLRGKKWLRICLCTEKNIRNDIAMDEHDVWMDMVITEEKTYEKRL